MLAVSMPNFATSAAFVETATKCLATDFSSPPRLPSDQSRGVRVGHRFQRGESLRGNDEERLRRVQIAHGFGKVRANDIGYEAKRHGPLAIVLQRFISHYRPEIGAANADVDDVANAFAGVPFPLAAADAIGKAGHLVQNCMDLRYDVFSVDDDGCE